MPDLTPRDYNNLEGKCREILIAFMNCSLYPTAGPLAASMVFFWSYKGPRFMSCPELDFFFLTPDGFLVKLYPHTVRAFPTGIRFWRKSREI